jgi:hypothetical protein
MKASRDISTIISIIMMELLACKSLVTSLTSVFEGLNYPLYFFGTFYPVLELISLYS